MKLALVKLPDDATAIDDPRAIHVAMTLIDEQVSQYRAGAISLEDLVKRYMSPALATLLEMP